MIVNGGSTLEIRAKALKEGYLPLAVDGILKVVNGVTTLEEINKKIILY